jgi:hypothetical protein
MPLLRMNSIHIVTAQDKKRGRTGLPDPSALLTLDIMRARGMRVHGMQVRARRVRGMMVRGIRR